MMEKMERWEREREGDKEGEKREAVEENRRRLRRIEIRQDRKEREERKKHVVIRGMKIEGKEVKEEVKGLWERMGLEEGGIKEVKRIARVGKNGEGMVKLEGLEEKRRVMEGRKKLRGGRERIDDDLTEEERRTRWKIEREGEKEREKGKKLQIGYMKMWVNGRMKRWNEIEEKWFVEQRNG